MTDSTSLQRKINSAGELRTVVRTMKAVAASNITQYEKAVLGLADYVRAIELGLGACLRQSASADVMPPHKSRPHIGAVVFGSDQGLVGQFNESVADFAISVLAGFPGQVKVWTVGDRVQGRLLDAGLSITGTFPFRGRPRASRAWLGRSWCRPKPRNSAARMPNLHLFHNRPIDGANYAPIRQRLLPLDDTWRREHMECAWPGHRHAQIMGTGASMLRALIGEYLFAPCSAPAPSHSRANRPAGSPPCSGPSAASKICSMSWVRHSHRLRQSQIDEELFDVVSGFEALKAKHPQPSDKSP